jgi:S1-C subfamily serine protease
MGRALRATAKVQLPFGAATGFYLGEFNGRHVFATNHHVCESAASCKNARIKFDILGFQAKVEEFYGSWTDVDLSLMSIKVPEDKVEALATVGRNFSFDAANEKGSELVTAGYGYAGNNSQKLVINYDDDCRVFSETGESRFMPDPDEKNPGPYKAWSYAIGCDVSHGDSGSAIVDRETGDVVGIVWTGRIPKAKKVQDSKFLDELLDDTGREEVWKELTYAVPANKIKEFLTKLVKDGALEGDDAKTISAVAGLKFRSAR